MTIKSRITVIRSVRIHLTYVWQTTM